MSRLEVAVFVFTVAIVGTISLAFIAAVDWIASDPEEAAANLRAARNLFIVGTTAAGLVAISTLFT